MTTNFEQVQAIVRKEWHQMIHSATLYRSMIDDVEAKRPVGLQTALADSFAVHMRNLVEFLMGSPHGNDPRAIDFFDRDSDKAKWQHLCSQEYDDLAKWKKTASQHLAHITKERVEQAEKTIEWKPREISASVSALLAELSTKTKHRSHPFWPDNIPSIPVRLALESEST